MTRPEPRARSHAPFIAGDPLRGIAALCVAASHLVGVSINTSNYPHVLGYRGAVGPAFGLPGELVATQWNWIVVFFVLSGYLLARPFVRSFVMAEPLPSLVAFARNRALRIVPAYWAALTLVLIFTTHHANPTVAGVIRTYAFDGNWAHNPLAFRLGQAWTLDMEMRFYVLLPIAFLLLIAAWSALSIRGSSRTRAGLLLVCAGAIVLPSMIAFAQSRLPATHGFDVNVGSFALGVAIAAVETLGLERLVESRRAPAAAAGCFAAGCTGLTLGTFAQQADSGVLNTVAGPGIALSATAVVAGPLLWQWSGRACWHGLDNRLLRWAGTRSYSIYLVHYAVFYEVALAVDLGGYKRQLVALALLGFPACLLAAEVLHRAVERPFLLLRAPPDATGSARLTDSGAGLEHASAVPIVIASRNDGEVPASLRSPRP